MHQKAILGFFLVSVITGCSLPRSYYEGSKEATVAMREIVRCAEKDKANASCDGKYKGKTFVGEVGKIDEEGILTAVQVFVASRKRYFICYLNTATHKAKIEKLQEKQLIKVKGNPGDVATQGTYTVVALDYCSIEENISEPKGS